MQGECNDILADYHEWRTKQPERISTHSDRCHMWHERCMMHRLAAALERARLDNAERFVLREVRDAYAERDDMACNEIAAVLDWLLERTELGKSARN